ncbi:hypothetical protein [Herbaspirillum seropedicae]|uniref:hypothetical protein n=1 Tax=Herbaspirillum seropedicae TaxID=964 RepID=UPI0028613D51|nr:hypothetical protein [Herbaspirillum seropedicae]MDR6397349.1 hypothetical protein [Herbaspirillum seropedicae]
MINAGGDLSMVAQRDLSLTAAQVAIGPNGSGSGSLMAGRAVTIGAALDKAESEVSHTASKSYTRADDGSVTVRGSNINADGISIKATAPLAILRNRPDCPRFKRSQR